jgi:hypothetical protein
MNRVYLVKVDPVPWAKNLRKSLCCHPKFSHIFDAVALLVFHMTNIYLAEKPYFVKIKGLLQLHLAVFILIQGIQDESQHH